MPAQISPIPELDAQRGTFRTTRWSIVAKAMANSNDAANGALAELCELYWAPVYAFLRRTGYSPDDSADYTQGFFAMLLEQPSLGGASAARGQFRNYLLGAVKHFISHELEKANARKRGGSLTTFSLNAAEAEFAWEPCTSETPETLFLRKWALCTLHAALNNLRLRYDREGKAALYAALAPHLLQDSAAPFYYETAEQLGISENAVKVAVHRLRARCREELRKLVADTVCDPAEVNAELHSLLSALSGETS